MTSSIIGTAHKQILFTRQLGLDISDEELLKKKAMWGQAFSLPFVLIAQDQNCFYVFLEIYHFKPFCSTHNRTIIIFNKCSYAELLLKIILGGNYMIINTFHPTTSLSFLHFLSLFLVHLEFQPQDPLTVVTTQEAPPAGPWYVILSTLHVWCVLMC